jgi:hypothetical protein
VELEAARASDNTALPALRSVIASAPAQAVRLELEAASSSRRIRPSGVFTG